MTEFKNNKVISKSKSLLYFEYILLGLCLCVLALRVTIAEGPAVRSTTMPTNISDSLYSLSVSSVLIFSFVLWIVWSLFTGKFIYRITGIEIGLVLFFIAAVISGIAASDKRAAITNFAVTLAPLLTAILLIQILDCQSKIKVILIIIAALGVLTAFECFDQYFVSNQVTIEQYEQNQVELIEPLGIEPGTFQHFLFEHRIYSRGVRGFFTTRNSAGSFLLMAFAVITALCINKLRDIKLKSSDRNYVLGCCAVAVIVLAALALTKSKGAFVGLFCAGFAFLLYLRFNKWLSIHRKTVVILCLLFFVAGCSGIAWYGLNHGRLPGGSSMLVRWQYWYASVRMYTDHLLTGVGPGNFADVYMCYKPAEALESVADPHNLFLSVLTQYGPLGLVALVILIFWPIWKAFFQNPEGDLRLNTQTHVHFKTLVKILLVILSVLIFIARAVSMPVSVNDLAVLIYIAIRFYIPPVVVFIVSFKLMTGFKRKTKDDESGFRDIYIVTAILLCGILGVIVHNQIDFAIFEPSVNMIFWVMIACLISMLNNQKSRPYFFRAVNLPAKLLGIGLSVIVIVVYIVYALVPVAGNTIELKKANHLIQLGRFEQAHSFLWNATVDDPYDSEALSQNGRLYLHNFKIAQSQNRLTENEKDYLMQAERCFTMAIERNKAAYKNYERLAETYCEYAEISTSGQKSVWFNKAFDAAEKAVEHYPGCGRLHLTLARIAEQLDKNDVAVENYKEAIKIEDEYREQFREIYPEREKLVSRIGEDAYRFAKERLEILTDQTNP